LHDGSAVSVLQSQPWHASPWFQKACREPRASLELIGDCDPTNPEAELVRDQPLSFDPRHRQWEWRSVLRHEPVSVENPTYTGDRHDPMAVL
jgi:CRISPR system Cascade subunit CasD